jgi:cation diffusion facilitator family transporter
MQGLEHLEKPMSTSKTQATGAGTSVTLIGVAANAVLIAFKLAGGLLGQSQALIADAAHSVSDLFSDVVVLVGLKAGRKAADQDHPFGHARMETLSSGVVGIFLIGAALFIGIDAASSIYNHTESHPTWLAVGVAALSIIVKEALYRYTVRVGRRIKSPVIMANAWHHRSDALSSVAVLLGVGAARIRPGWHILDAYAALIVSLLILKVGIEILWRSIQELTDTAPPPETLDEVGRCIRGVDGVLGHHDLRVRTSGGLYQMEAHIVVDGSLTVIEGHEMAKSVEFCLKDEIEDLSQVIIHVDPYLKDEKRSHSQEMDR